MASQTAGQQPVQQQRGLLVDTTAVELYRLRWALDDISCFVRELRARHRRTAGTEHAWQALDRTVAQLTQ